MIEQATEPTFLGMASLLVAMMVERIQDRVSRRKSGGISYKDFNALKEQVGRQQPILDLLKTVYLENALDDARRAGVTKRNSPEVPTEKWVEALPSELIKQLDDTARALLVQKDEHSVVWDLYKQHRISIHLALAKNGHELTTNEFIGGLMAFVSMAKNG